MKQCPACKREWDQELTGCPFDGENLVDSLARSPLIGKLLDDKYRLEEKIGEGGMGTVFRGFHVEMENTVAVKILHPHLSSEKIAVERFRREARAAAQIRHPNAVAVMDFGVTWDGIAYLVMEFLEGSELRVKINKKRQLDCEETFSILSQVCSSVQAAHAKGIIHRDLKPDNIWLEGTEGTIATVKVLDFGIAKLNATASNLTQAGMIVGTPYYMSPEQCLGEELDPRSDIYSLGVVLYEMLTGRVPFHGETALAVVLKHNNEQPRPLHDFRENIPAAVERVVLRALSKKREDRQASAIELAQEFKAALPSTSIGLIADEAAIEGLTDPAQALQSLKRCPACNHEFPAAVKFCPFDGQILDKSHRASFQTVMGELAGSDDSEANLEPSTGCAPTAPMEATPAGVTVLERGTFVIASRSRRRLLPGAETVSRSLSILARAMTRVAELFAMRTRRNPETRQQSIARQNTSQQEAGGGGPIHLSAVLESTSVGPEVQHNRGKTVWLRHSEVYLGGEDHKFEELLLHKDYERLWRSLMHAGGGRNLLTGYGPFGGTSLVQCAIEKARQELKRAGKSEAALLVFYFDVTAETRNDFELEASSFGLAHLHKTSDPISPPGLRELRVRADSQLFDGKSAVMNLVLNKALGRTFFSPLANEGPSATSGGYNFIRLVADLNSYLKENKPGKELGKIAQQLVQSDSLRSRVVIILDGVKHIETLETLAESELLGNRRTRTVAIGRKEHLDQWTEADERLGRMGFDKWYVPCLWKVDFEKSLFKGADASPEAKDAFKRFVLHLEYKGRGSLGNVIAELRHPRNTSFGDGTSYIEVCDLATRADVQHNSWMQELLDNNWDPILRSYFGGPEQDEKVDRAKIGTYHVIDWLVRERRFALPKLVEQSSHWTSTISDSAEITHEIIENLLYVLTKARYLECQQERYSVIWDKNRPPKIRRFSTRSRRRGISVNRASEHNHPTPEANAVVIPFRKKEEPAELQDCDFSYIQNAEVVLTTSEPHGSAPTAGAMPTLISGSPRSADKCSFPGTQTLQIPTGTEGSCSASRPEGPENQKGNKVIKREMTETVTKRTELTIEAEEGNGNTLGILIVFANPRGSDALRLGEEDRIIRSCIERGKNRARFREKVIHAARITDVQRQLLDSDYNIVHFSGHATPNGELAFEDEQGNARLVGQQPLTDLLRQFHTIECVVLNSCNSLNQGQLISKAVPFTVAVEQRISDVVAGKFTQGFYDALCAGKDYRFAYEMGRQALELEGHTANYVLLERPSQISSSVPR